MVHLRHICLQLQRGKYRAQKHPIASLAAHQIGMLALPPQTSSLPQRFFRNRGRIHKDFHLPTALLNQPAGQAFQPFFDNIVIVFSLSIDADIADIGSVEIGQRIALRA